MNLINQLKETLDDDQIIKESLMNDLFDELEIKVSLNTIDIE